jgi:5'-methylthioadenosine phosphorylase
MDKIEIGIIGGSGIYELENMKIIEEKEIKTPFGIPSEKYIIGEIGGVKFAFLSRHGKGHRIMPTELNNRANIYGFKMLGVKYLISFNAVGSLKEEIEPSHLVFPNQIIDRTKFRISTFFGEGIVAHPGFANPVCEGMIKLFEESSKKLNIPFHSNKTYVCMEGPLFSTKAESNFHRQIGGDIIGMTAIPEAKLAREAEMCYGIIALSTD